jgi:colicin import membrane protein
MARRYVRDNRGRFASVGATARGGRLKTAGGSKRQTQTMQASAAPKGTISKPAGLKPGAIKPKVSSARQEATNRLKIKTEIRRKLRTDRASVVPAKPSGPKTMKAARPQSTVAKPRTKGNTKAQVASRVERKAAANRANLAAIIRAERVGAGRGRQYERALKRQMTLDRAQNYLQTGKLPGRDNSIAAQRKMRQAKDRLAATNAARAAAAAAKPVARRPDQAEVNIKGRFAGQAGKRFDASIDRAVKEVQASERARLMKPKAQVRAERAAAAEAKRQAAAAKPKRTRTPESLRMSRAKQIEKRRGMNISNPAAWRPESAGRMAANAARTQERAIAFYRNTAKPRRR